LHYRTRAAQVLLLTYRDAGIDGVSLVQLIVLGNAFGGQIKNAKLGVVG